MNINNSQLLITFSSPTKVDSIINNIIKAYSINFNKIFLLNNLDNKNEIIISYNINLDNQINDEYIPYNTISVHRKKYTNTLYTINALNYLISVLNDGKLDKNFSLPWENYKNCILIINNSEFKKINTSIYKIISL